MKSIWRILTILIAFGFGCSNYAPEHGKSTIDEKKMAEMVADIHIIEAYIQNVQATERDSVKTILYHELFKIYAVDTAVFYENQRLYYENPAKVETLYKAVLEKLDETDKDLNK